MADDSEIPPLPRPRFEKRLRRWRFAMIVVVLAMAVVAAAAAGWRFARTSAAPSNGPIIIISIDTLRADHLPIYGYHNVRTPAIDALAAEGVVFDRAYAHSPQTLPSHASILSGQLPFEHGVRDEVGFMVKPETRLLPQLLKARGYTTGAVVSSYLLRAETGLAQAFDFYNSDMPAPADASAALPGERAGAEAAAVAQKWIASVSSPRFFLFLHINEPHAPYVPPPKFAQYTPYDGEIASADEVIGRFVKWLHGKGLYDRATIVVLSDHGEGLGDHGEQEHGLFLYDETIRVPLVVKLPRDVNHGHRVAAPVQHIDIVPTILDLLDLARPAGLRGRSLRALLEGRKGTPPPQPFYAESFSARYWLGWSGLRAVTDGTYRFVDAPHPELYDLVRDPAQHNNVAADRPEAAQSMRLLLDEFAAPTPEVNPPSVPFAERERLASLGYLVEAVVAGTPVRQPVADPKDGVSVYEKCRQARYLAGQQRDQEAAALFREALAEAPSDAMIWLQFAVAMQRAARLADAVEAFRQAGKLADAEPLRVVAAAGAARALLEIGKLDEAKAQATLAVKGAPGEAHEILARVALARDDAASARREGELAQEADPQRPVSLFVQASLLNKAGKYEEAVPLFDKAVQAQRAAVSPIAGLHSAYAEALAQLDRFGDAEAQLNEELRLFPRALAARTSLAMLYHAQRRDDDARRAVEDLLRLTPTAEGYAAAARLWTILGDRDRATETRNDAKAKFGSDAPPRRAR